MNPALWLNVLLVLPLAALAQQQGQPTTVIKTETRVVQVDAVVTDKSGNLVPGLTARDFHVWEDNKEQTIQSISLETPKWSSPSEPKALQGSRRRCKSTPTPAPNSW